MAENKTKPTTASVADYFAAIEDDARRKDCQALSRLMTKASKQKPTMWGTAIVGFGRYHYKYESGREGEMCLLGFASRKGDISIYGIGDFPAKEKLLAKLGKHKTAKGCLYVRRLDDVDAKVLEALFTASLAARKQRAG